MKKNCWEVMECGKEGTCPAHSEVKLNGIHGGRNAGRTCWVVAGTACGGIKQGRYAEKMASCQGCKFYQLVHDEEIKAKKEKTGEGFLLGGTLTGILRK